MEVEVEAVLIRKIYFWESTRREIREKNPSSGIVTFCGRKEGISQSAMDGAVKKIKRDLETRQIFYNQDLVYCLETYNFVTICFMEVLYIKI